MRSGQFESLLLQIIDPDGRPKRCVPLRPGLTLLGSRTGCKVRLASRRVSPVHCAIVHRPGQTVVRDLASRTGLSVNDWDAEVGALGIGDSLGIRQWRFLVTGPGSQSPPAPSAEDASDRTGPRSAIQLLAATERIELRDSTGRTLLQSQCPVVLVGRHERCDCTLSDGQASRVHAVLFHTGSGWAVADLFSANGTRLDGQTIEPRGAGPEGTPLHDGDVLGIGESHLTVRLGAEQSAEGSAAGTQVDEPAVWADELDQRAVELAGLGESLQARQHEIEAQEQALRERAISLEQEKRRTSGILAKVEATTAVLQQRSVELDGLRRDCEDVQETLEARAATLAAMERDLARRAADIERHESTAEEQRAELARLTVEARAAQAHGDAVREKEVRLAGVAEDLHAERTALDDAASDVAKRERQLSSATSALVDRASSVAQADKQLELLVQRERALHDRDIAVAADRKKLDAAAGAMAEREAELRVELQKLGEREKRVADTEKALADRQRSLEQAIESLRVERTNLAERQKQCGLDRQQIDARIRRVEQGEAAVREQMQGLRKRQTTLAAETREQNEQSERQATRRQRLKSVAGAVRKRHVAAAARESLLDRREQGLQSRESKLEQIAQATTARLDQLVKMQRDLERRAQNLEEKEARQEESAEVLRSIATTLEHLEEQLDARERAMRQGETEFNRRPRQTQPGSLRAG